jgi:8-oxo-dGTP pyrophosphatase MutT (NUDIX family)/catechol 2,3-dioxygenase-like lactoylglutathione lyase family enzyme
MPPVSAPSGRQRIAAYAVIRDGSGRVLLVRASALSHFPGLWFLPGGGVDHGEQPEDAVRREVLEETGLDVRVRGLTTVQSDVAPLPDDGCLLHTVRLVYDVDVLSGVVRAERDGTTEEVRWCAQDAMADLPLIPFVRPALSQATATPSVGVHHIEIYVADLDRSIAFWQPLLERLGWTGYQSWPAGRSWRLGETYIVFVQVSADKRQPSYDRRLVGLNHLALHAGTPEHVDALVRELGVPLLYANRHPYAGGPDHYAAYVQDPDGIKVELVATPSGRGSQVSP